MFHTIKLAKDRSNYRKLPRGAKSSSSASSLKTEGVAAQLHYDQAQRFHKCLQGEHVNRQLLIQRIIASQLEVSYSWLHYSTSHTSKLYQHPDDHSGMLSRKAGGQLHVNECLANFEQNVTGCGLEKEVEAFFSFENSAFWPSIPKYVIGTRSQGEFEVGSRNAQG